MPGTAFILTAHACRHCAGRVLRAGDQFRCSGCGVVTMHTPNGICGCGLLPNFRAGKARFQCGLNPAKGVNNPSEVVIMFGDAPLQVAAE